jgi:hypothetical protein
MRERHDLLLARDVIGGDIRGAFTLPLRLFK